MSKLHKVLRFPVREPERPRPRRSRDSEGSIIPKTEERRVGKKTKKVIVYYVRCRYTDLQGVRREKKRKTKTYADALVERRKMRDEIAKEKAGNHTADRKPKYFSQVLDHYETKYVKPAEYSGSEKVEGLREPIAYVKRHLKLFREEFGKMYAGEITYENLLDFKLRRLRVPVTIEYWEKIPLSDEERRALKTKRKFRREKRSKTRPRAVASVQRELQRLRRIFNIALRKGWISENPFKQGDPLISQAAETERVRILSFDEERRLLAACTGKSEHLKAILICALDTALRKNELFTLTWGDVDLAGRRITVQALNSKTLKERTVPVSKRLLAELEELREATHAGESSLVFGIRSSAKKAFGTAARSAGIADFRFHDLRGTAITRFLRAGLPAPEVMKISGHTNWKTFMRYVKVDDDTIERAGSAMDDYHSRRRS